MSLNRRTFLGLGAGAATQAIGLNPVGGFAHLTADILSGVSHASTTTPELINRHFFLMGEASGTYKLSGTTHWEDLDDPTQHRMNQFREELDSISPQLWDRLSLSDACDFLERSNFDSGISVLAKNIFQIPKDRLRTIFQQQIRNTVRDDDLINALDLEPKDIESDIAFVDIVCGRKVSSGDLNHIGMLFWECVRDIFQKDGEIFYKNWRGGVPFFKSTHIGTHMSRVHNETSEVPMNIDIVRFFWEWYETDLNFRPIYLREFYYATADILKFLERFSSQMPQVLINDMVTELLRIASGSSGRPLAYHIYESLSKLQHTPGIPLGLINRISTALATRANDSETHTPTQEHPQTETNARALFLEHQPEAPLDIIHSAHPDKTLEPILVKTLHTA